jgi:3-phosphoinositide dependent protein kinase-1
MKALRAHPFFSSIDWVTLWTGPAPPLEPGLVKREIVSRKDANAMWEDVGANWDETVTREGLADDDEIAWAEDTEDPTIPANRREKVDEVLECSYEEEGPLGEIRRFTVTTDIRVEEEDTATLVGHSSGAAPIPVRPTNGNASGSSSSDGSPTDSIGTRLDNMVLDRGRNRAQTPVQGNFQLSDVDLYVF